MPCFTPLWRTETQNINLKTGKPIGVVYRTRPEGFADGEGSPIACGRCIGCRLEYSRQWAMRCVDEGRMHEANSFITLTYNDDHLPKDKGLNHRDWQLFMKRLRKAVAPKRVKFFMCGEYGPRWLRPHFHAVIFGHQFSDLRFFKNNRGSPLYTSETLDRLWQSQGFSTVGAFTFETAAYVSGYVTKKATGYGVDFKYSRMDDEGKWYPVAPEYAKMSLNPAIGKEYFAKFSGDHYPSDDYVLKGRRMKPPKYYDGLFEIDNPNEMTMIRRARRDAGRNSPDKTPERLRAREINALERAKRKGRKDDDQ